jgi:hypothetical protein
MQPDDKADIADVINIARHGHDHDEIVRQVAAQRHCSWNEAEQLVQQVMTRHSGQMKAARFVLLLLFPLGALAVVSLLWLTIGAFAVLVVLGGLLILGAAADFDFSILMPHIIYERLEMWHIGLDYETEKTPEVIARQQKRYRVVAYVLGGVLMVLGLVLGIGERFVI